MAESGFRRRYGASPWHLLAVLFNLVVVGYVVTRLTTAAKPWQIVLWFAGSIALQDFVVLPLLVAVDRLIAIIAQRTPDTAVPWRNHVRFPLLLAGLLLLVFWPLVLRHAPANYRAATGLSVEPYRARWLAIVAVIFLVSAVVYIARWLHERRAGLALRRREER